MYLFLHVQVQCHGRSKSFSSSIFKESKDLTLLKSNMINHSFLLQTISYTSLVGEYSTEFSWKSVCAGSLAQGGEGVSKLCQLPFACA